MLESPKPDRRRILIWPLVILLLLAGVRIVFFRDQPSFLQIFALTPQSSSSSVFGQDLEVLDSPPGNNPAYAFKLGGKITYGFEIENTSSFAVTILGFPPDPSELLIRKRTLMTPIERSGSQEHALPFKTFVLEPGGKKYIYIEAEVGHCDRLNRSRVQKHPTESRFAREGDNFVSKHSERIKYRALGITRTALIKGPLSPGGFDIRLPADLKSCV